MDQWLSLAELHRQAWRDYALLVASCTQSSRTERNFMVLPTQDTRGNRYSIRIELIVRMVLMPGYSSKVYWYKKWVETKRKSQRKENNDSGSGCDAWGNAL